MSQQESEKELAFLHELYVAPDWGERFAALIDEHVKLPKDGTVLYVAAGTGGHALALKERAGADVTLVGVDESEERLKLARVKAAAVKLGAVTQFRLTQLEALDFEDAGFDLVLGDASLVAPERLPEMLAELARVAAPGSTVAFSLPTASSFGEFYSIYWEALANVELFEETPLVEQLITELPTIAGAEFLSALLVKGYLLRHWLEPLADETAHARVLAEVERIIDDERQAGDFTLSIKATLVVGQKAR